MYELNHLLVHISCNLYPIHLVVLFVAYLAVWLLSWLVGWLVDCLGF